MQTTLFRGALALVLILSMVSLVTVVTGDGVAAQTPNTFADDDGNIHEANIEFIAAAGVTKGCNPPANTNYCPSGTVTRGQMAAFLSRALDLPATTADFFGDDETSIFEGDINRLAAAGITSGCNPPANTNYCPEGKVTRGQMAAFIDRGFDLPSTSEDFFVDDETSVFQGNINRLAASGITFGCNPPTNTNFCPSQTVKRDQMASFLARALTNFPPTTTTSTTTTSTTSSTTTSSTTTTTTVATNPVFTQAWFGIYSDGTEAGAAIIGPINEGVVVTNSTTFGIRVGMTNTGTGLPVNVQPKLQYRFIGPDSPNGPGWSDWVDVTGASARLAATDSVDLVDGAVTTERLNGPLTFGAGRLDDANGAIETAVAIASNAETEFLFSVRLTGADDTDQYDFRLVDATSGTPYDAYGELPSVNLPYTFANGFETGVDAAVVKTADIGDPDRWSQVSSIAPVKEITTIDVGTSTGGTFTLTVDSQTTTAIAYNAIAADVKSALETLSTVTTVSVAGTGTTIDPWVVTFDSPIGSLLVSGDGALLTGGSLTLTETAVGRVGAPVYDSGFAAQGLMSALFQRVNGDTATYLRTNDFNQAQDLYGRVYFRYTGFPAPAGTRIVDVVSGYDVPPTDSNSHSITVQANGRVLMKAGGVVGTGDVEVTLTPALLVDTWYRFEWHATTESAVGALDGTFELTVYNPDDSPFATATIINAPTKTEFEDADFGPRTQTVTAWIDGIVLSNQVLPAP